VLVRKRDAFVNALTRALKRRGNIPVAGADRLKLTSHIAVQDLVALGRFLLLPEDDLSLAALMKSPLFDLSEDDIFAVAALAGMAKASGGTFRRSRADGNEAARRCSAEAAAVSQRSLRISPCMISMPVCSASMAGDGSSWRGSAPRSAISSTNS
jgi:ATP-dependent helicase/nuclease subunit A